MKLLALAALLFLGCASSGRTANVRGTGEAHYVEIRIENHNWNLARVYARSPHSNVRRRLAEVTTNNGLVIHWRPIFPEFELHVTFLGSWKTWTSQTWFEHENCLKLVITATLVHSRVVPCYLGEKS